MEPKPTRRRWFDVKIGAMARAVILTGLRTNDQYHLGNYIGALMPIIESVKDKAADYQINLFAPDLHSFTTPIDHSHLHRQTMANLRLFVAAGVELDNPNVYLYRQSQLPAHSEATWILANFSSFGELSRMVEFKDKQTRLGADQISVGLFSYPVLMAADILMHDGRWVPVGDDQRQHLEFCRKLAKRINQRFGQLFVVPEATAKQLAFFSRRQAPRILNLKQPNQKMSKSIDDPAGTIMLLETPQQASAKIMAATTDNLAQINYDEQQQPGITNLLTILASVTNQDQDQVNQAWQGKSDYASFKKTVAEAVAELLTDIQTRLNQVSDKQLLTHLERSETELNRRLESKLERLQTAVGLRA